MLTRNKKREAEKVTMDNETGVQNKGNKRKYKGMDLECEESGDSYQPESENEEENEVSTENDEEQSCDNSGEQTMDQQDSGDSDFAEQGKEKIQRGNQQITAEQEKAAFPKDKVSKQSSKISKRQKSRRFREWKLNKIDDDGILQIFRMFDVKGKGYINSSDVSRVVHDLMLDIDYEQQDEMMKRAAEITGGSKTTIEPEQLFTLINRLKQ